MGNKTLIELTYTIISVRSTLRMSATGRSYTQNFFKVQYIIIQAILGRKSMKKFIVTNEKIFCVYKRLLMLKDNIHTDLSQLRTSHAQFLGKDSHYREEDSGNKILS